MKSLSTLMNAIVPALGLFAAALNLVVFLLTWNLVHIGLAVATGFSALWWLKNPLSDR